VPISFTWLSDFRIRLLLGCHILESDSARWSSNRQVHDDPLCGAQLKDAPQFISMQRYRAKHRHMPHHSCRTWICQILHITIYISCHVIGILTVHVTKAGEEPAYGNIWLRAYLTYCLYTFHPPYGSVVQLHGISIINISAIYNVQITFFLILLVFYILHYHAPIADRTLSVLSWL